jgi:hypothetical protein
MRKLLVLVGFLFSIALLAGCGDDNGNSKAPVANLTGNWSSQTVGANSLTMSLTATNSNAGGFVSGTGNFTDANGIVHPIQISGSVSRNIFNLDIQFTQSANPIVTGVYSGSIPDANHLNGTVHIPGTPDVAIPVVRQ